MNRISVNVEGPRQAEVSSLLAQSDAVAEVLYPGEFRRSITAESLAKPDTYVLVARRAGTAVGLCVLFDRGDRTMELKRMIVERKSRPCGLEHAPCCSKWGYAMTRHKSCIAAGVTRPASLSLPMRPRR